MPRRSGLAELFQVIHPTPGIVTAGGGSIVRTVVNQCYLVSQPSTAFFYWDHELPAIVPIELLEAGVRHEKASAMGHSIEPKRGSHPETMLVRLYEDEIVLSLQLKVEDVAEFLQLVHEAQA